MNISRLETDVLVIGGGIAGLWAAMRARDSVDNVLVVDKAEPGKCGQSVLAAGDVDILPPGYDIDLLTETWMREFPLASRRLVQDFLKQSWDRVVEMQGWGIEFEETPDGKLDVRSGPGGKRRVMSPGRVLVGKIREACEARGINFLGRIFVSDLLTDGERVTGAVGFNVWTGEPVAIRAKSVVMAAGCFGLKATNFQGSAFLAGDPMAIAFRAGAQLCNMDFLRGNTGHRDYNTIGMAKFSGAFGGRFLNSVGEPFMKKYRPDAEKPDAAQYHEFWVAMAKEVKAGRGPIYFDITRIKPDDYALSRRLLPHLYRVLDSAGIDIREKPMEWIPNSYRGFGQLVHGYDFQSTLRGLYVGGDASGGVTLGWAIFTGCQAGVFAGKDAANVDSAPFNGRQAEELLVGALAPIKRASGPTPDEVTLKIQEVMVPYPVLILKTASSLKSALVGLETIRALEIPAMRAIDHHELMKANEANNMALTSEMHLRAALMRTESRNFHYREEYPSTNDTDWLKWICVSRKGEEMVFSVQLILP